MNVGMVLSICVVYLLDFLWNIVHGKWAEFTNTEWLVFLINVMWYSLLCQMILKAQSNWYPVKYFIKWNIFTRLPWSARRSRPSQTHYLSCFKKILYDTWYMIHLYIKQNLHQIILLCKALEIYPFSVAHISVQVFCSLNLASIHHKDNSVISGGGKTFPSS